MIQQDQNIVVTLDTFSLLNPVTNLRYLDPCITTECIHQKACFEGQQARDSINQLGQFQCPNCKGVVKSLKDLKQDWRHQAYKEFNKYTAEITVIKSKMINKLIRNKIKYQNFFLKDEYGNQFLQLYNRFTQDSSIITMIQKNLRDSKNFNKKIQFWSFCLLDRVKITIPVRLIGCDHFECYELTSLLFYQEQNRKKKQFLDCTQPGCSNRLKIAHKDYELESQTPDQNQNQTPQDQIQMEEENKSQDIKTLFSGICLDFDLLNAIKISNPSSYKFLFNHQTQRIEEDINVVDGKIVDTMILSYFQKKDVQTKCNFEEFQNSIQQQAQSVSNGELLMDDQVLAKRIALYKYRNYKVKMQDPLTQMNIEFPVRCKFCTDLSLCIDMRSYIADFNFQKKLYPSKTYQCPLCKKNQSQQIYKANIQNYIYLDSNMLSYMFKDLSYTNGTKMFEYQGEQYMRQEFFDRQKIRREEYLKSLESKTLVEFKQLFCVVNQNFRIKEPLLLQKCPQSSIVDFSSFYDKLKEIDFDIEQKGLILCICQSCNANPIKSILGNIYFHEPFYEALNKFYKIPEIQKLDKFSYQFAKEQQDSNVVFEIQSNNPKIRPVSQPKQGDASLVQKLQGEEGFFDLMNDEEYQKFFSKKDIQGYKYEPQSMNQTIGVFKIIHEKNGVKANLKEAMHDLNQNANPQLKEFNFKVTGIRLQLNSEILNQNKGEFEYNQ